MACDAKTGFSGTERKVWLYVNRINNNVTAENIVQYLKNKPNHHEVEFIVRELPGNPKALKRFVIAAPFELKDEMYSKEFWPTGVGVKRFSFDKFRELNNGMDFL